MRNLRPSSLVTLRAFLGKFHAICDIFGSMCREIIIFLPVCRPDRVDTFTNLRYDFKMNFKLASGSESRDVDLKN